MAEDTQKVQVIEVVGTKLDPDASYILAYQRGTMSRETGHELLDIIEERFGVNAVVVETYDDPHKSLRFFSIPKPSPRIIGKDGPNASN